MKWISRLISVILVSSIFFAVVKFMISPSREELITKLNEDEYKTHFRARVERSYIDSANRYLYKLVLNMEDTTVVYWPRYIEQAHRQIKEGDSLIKIKNAFVYEVKRGDSSFFVHVEPFTVK